MLTVCQMGFCLLRRDRSLGIESWWEYFPIESLLHNFRQRVLLSQNALKMRRWPSVVKHVIPCFTLIIVNPIPTCMRFPFDDFTWLFSNRCFKRGLSLLLTTGSIWLLKIAVIASTEYLVLWIAKPPTDSAFFGMNKALEDFSNVRNDNFKIMEERSLERNSFKLFLFLLTSLWLIWRKFSGSINFWSNSC